MAAAVRENALGAARCPLCASGKASLRLSAKGLAYLVCNSCNVQVFARSERSDDGLRDLLIPAAPAPGPIPAPEPAPAPTPTPEPANAPPAPAPGLPWGFFK